MHAEFAVWCGAALSMFGHPCYKPNPYASLLLRLRKFRERHPKSLVTTRETVEILESFPPEQNPRAAEMAERMRTHLDAFSELPGEDTALWNQILAHGKALRELSSTVQERPRTELTTPREEQLRREIDLLQQRLDALKTDLDVLKPSTPQP